MAAWTATARHAANMARLSSTKSASTAKPASLVHRRGLAGGGDHHGPPKVNFWEDPMHPSKWKEEHGEMDSSQSLCDVEERITGAMYALCSGPRFHSEKVFVLVSLAGWGTVIYGGYKLFTKGKEDKKEERVEERPH